MSQPLHKTYKARITRPGTRVDNDAFEKSEQSFDRDGPFFDETSEVFPTDAHGHLMRSQQEVGGACYCGSLLCVKCVERACEIDGRALCKLHAVEIEPGSYVCTEHGTLRLAFHLMTRKRKPE